jgi:hypothetical protein
MDANGKFPGKFVFSNDLSQNGQTAFPNSTRERQYGHRIISAMNPLVSFAYR